MGKYFIYRHPYLSLTKLLSGFGLAIGSSTFTKITKISLPGQDDVTCSMSHRPDGPWYQRTPSVAWGMFGTGFLMFDALSFDCSFLDCTHVFSMAQSPILRTMEPQRTSTCSTHMCDHGTYSYTQPLLIAISCLGWATNHFTGLKFPGQNDVSSAAGAFAVGFVSNLYARFFKGNAFVIMVSDHVNES